MTYRISSGATRTLRKLPADVRKQIFVRLDRLADTGEGDVSALKGRVGYRLRVGDHRVLFTRDDDRIDVFAVGHRREIYK